MFNIGFAEFMVIAVLALVLLGPDQLPSAIRSLAKVIRDIRRTTSGLKDQLDPEFHSVTRDLRDAIEGDVDAAAFKNPPLKPRPPRELPKKEEEPKKEEPALVVRPPSEEEGRPVPRGAAFQADAPAPSPQPQTNEAPKP